MRFGSSESEAIDLFGKPNEVIFNREGEKGLFYENFVVRFDAADFTFREFTFLPKCPMSVDGIRIEWNESALRTVQAIDGNMKEVLGFVISIRLGLAFAGFHDEQEAERSVHAFRRGDWDDFKERMVDL